MSFALSADILLTNKFILLMRRTVNTDQGQIISFGDRGLNTGIGLNMGAQPWAPGDQS